MPWTPRDAYGHTHKANTPRAQRKWASVANSVLESGKDEATAIRIANDAISNEKQSLRKARKPRPSTMRSY